MWTNLFSFDLPSHLIARRPPKNRGESRMMVLDRGSSTITHGRVSDLPGLLEPGLLMVFNDSRVRKARLYAVNETTGARGEFLFLESHPDGAWDCMVKRAERRRKGQRWIFPGGVVGTIIDLPDAKRRRLMFTPPVGEPWFEAHGQIPLPPYLGRPAEPLDGERYQTVYAARTGSVAAPTAGLHFTGELLEAVRSRGVHMAHLTLHVGPGTFLPVRKKRVEDHRMHAESYSIPPETAAAVMRARAENRRVLAVGTTTVRSLESAWDGEKLREGEGSTDLFIYPGYRFNVVDRLISNFHTPESSLIMLVSAFCGREKLLKAYRAAVEEGYRFFSYGDVMLIR